MFKPAAFAAGLGLKAVDTAVVSPLSFFASRAIPTPVAKALKNSSNFVIDKAVGTLKVGTGAKQMPKFEDWRLFSIKSSDPLERRLKSLDNKLSFFRSVGRMTDNTFQISTEAKTMIKARSRTIEKYLESIEKKIL